MRCTVPSSYQLGEHYKGLSMREAEQKACEDWWTENIGSTVKEYLRWFAEDGLFPYEIESWEACDEEMVITSIEWNGTWATFEIEWPAEKEEVQAEPYDVRDEDYYNPWLYF